MKKLSHSLYTSLACLFALVAFSLLIAPSALAGEEEDFLNGEWAMDDIVVSPPPDKYAIADPLEPLNRVFFVFNDKLYFWVLKPAAKGYKTVVRDEDIRLCINNFFYNLLAPVRIVNNLLQGKMVGAGNEFASFVINSTLGVAGLADPAHNEFGLEISDEDFGQTLGTYGIGNGFYICWPIFGPSSLRNSVGLAGDTFVDPLYYLTVSDETLGYSVYAGKMVNKYSLNLGDYEQFKEASFDPYVAVRNAYAQHHYVQVEMRGFWRFGL